MIGSLNPKCHQVTVIGGGIAGLLISYALDKKGYQVTLFEAKERVGGLIQTSRTEDGIAESAAHSLLATPEVLDLFQELNVELLPVNPDSKARFIWRRGKLRRFPLGFLEVIQAFIRAYFVLSPRKKAPDSLTLQEWGSRFLGNSAVHYLLSPMIRGIFATTPDQLLVGAAFPHWIVPHGHSILSFQLEKLRRNLFKKSKKRPRSKIMAPRLGMEEVIRALEIRLKEKIGSRFHTGVDIKELPSQGNIVLAVPAESASQLLSQTDSKLAEALRQIKYVPLVSVTVFIRSSQLVRAPKGVGVLFPQDAKMNGLGILFNSSAFKDRTNPNSEVISLSVLLGGSEYPEVLDLPDSEVLEKIAQDLKQVFGFQGQFTSYKIHRWQKAIPLYNEALVRAWSEAKQGWCSIPGRVLFGNYTGQVSIRGMIETLFNQESERITRVE